MSVFLYAGPAERAGAVSGAIQSQIAAPSVSIQATNIVAGTILMGTTPVTLPAIADATWATQAKQLYFAEYPPASGTWYKMGGDHNQVSVPASSVQGGRQEIFKFVPSTNTFTRVQDYWLPGSSSGNGSQNPVAGSTLQFSDPDDCAGCFVRGSEIWLTNSATNHAEQWATDQNTGTYTGSAYAFPMFEHLMAWTPSTTLNAGTWRTIMPNLNEWRGDRCAHAYYDSFSDHIYFPCNVGGSLTWVVVDAATGTDLTLRSGGVAFSWGLANVGLSGLAGDPATRIRYVVETQYYTALMAMNLATDTTPSFVNSPGFSGSPPFLELPGLAVSGQSEVSILWHPVLRAIIVYANFVWVYEIDTGTLTRLNRTDGYFPRDYGSTDPVYKDLFTLASAHFYDTVTNSVVNIGTIDFGTPQTFAGLYWRNTFTKI